MSKGIGLMYVSVIFRVPAHLRSHPPMVIVMECLPIILKKGASMMSRLKDSIFLRWGSSKVIFGVARPRRQWEYSLTSEPTKNSAKQFKQSGVARVVVSQQSLLT